jgi:hypothetical protein
MQMSTAAVDFNGMKKAFKVGTTRRTETMLRKIGLLTVLAAGFVVTVLTVALCATPLVVELTRLYQPKDQLTFDESPVKEDMLVVNGSLLPVSWCKANEHTSGDDAFNSLPRDYKGGYVDGVLACLAYENPGGLK